jgi:hypothetical protein
MFYTGIKLSLFCRCEILASAMEKPPEGGYMESVAENIN